MVKRKYNRDDNDEEQGYERTSVVPGGRQGPPAQELCYELLDALFSGYEQVEHEVMATDIISIGRLREMCQAWIVPRMPDPLPMYLAELERRGYHLRITYDGSQALFLRKRMNPDAMKYAQAIDELSLDKPQAHVNLDNCFPDDNLDDEEDEKEETIGMTSVGAVIKLMRSKTDNQ